MDIKLLKIYIEKFIKKKLNFHGIFLIPTINEVVDVPRISWKMENPNNISYTRFAVKNFIETSLEEFFSLVGYNVDTQMSTRRAVIRNRYIILDYSIDDVYISPEMERTLEDKIREEVTIGFGNYQIKSKGFDCHISSYHEEITLDVSMMILEMFNKKLNKVLDEEEIKKFLGNVFQNADEQELYDILTWHISSILYNSPTIFDQDEMYMRDLVSFFDENKDIIDFNWG